MTRSTQACFLTADSQRTELPLLRLPPASSRGATRSGVAPSIHAYACVKAQTNPRPSARGLFEGACCEEGRVRSRSPVVHPTPPIGPLVSGPASQIRFSRVGQARGAYAGSLDQRSEEWPLCEGKSGAPRRLRPALRGELRGPRGASIWRCREGAGRGRGADRGGGVSSRFRVANTCLLGRGLRYG